MVRCALLSLLAVLASCKTSSSPDRGSHVTIGLGMTLAAVKASCPDPFELIPLTDVDTTVVSHLRHSITILGLGKGIDLEDGLLHFSLLRGRVTSISVNQARGPIDRGGAEMVAENLGDQLIAEGWCSHPQNSPLHRVYGRDAHPATLDLRFLDMAGTEAAKQRNLPGEYWLIDLGLFDVSNGR